MKRRDLQLKKKVQEQLQHLVFFRWGDRFILVQYGAGVFDLLLWPYSVLWDPINGYNGAQEINYHATVANFSKLKNTDMSDLDALLMTKQVDNGQYMLKKRAIEKQVWVY